jgi:hypothetical protein
MSVRLATVDVLGGIGTQAAERVLELSLLDPDPQIRQRVGAAVQSALRSSAELQADRGNIGAALAVEIAHHYRSYQVLLRLCEIASGFPQRIAQLRETMEREAERIFRLLGILYPDSDLDSAYAAIRSRVPAIRDSALELLDNTLDPHLRRLLVPLFDESLSVRERARIATRLFGGEAEQSKVVGALVHSGDAWLRHSGALAARGLRFASADPHSGSVPARSRIAAAMERVFAA